jgi:hypothetical protein
LGDLDYRLHVFTDSSAPKAGGENATPFIPGNLSILVPIEIAKLIESFTCEKSDPALNNQRTSAM